MPSSHSFVSWLKDTLNANPCTTVHHHPPARWRWHRPMAHSRPRGRTSPQQVTPTADIQSNVHTNLCSRLLHTGVYHATEKTDPDGPGLAADAGPWRTAG